MEDIRGYFRKYFIEAQRNSRDSILSSSAFSKDFEEEEDDDEDDEDAEDKENSIYKKNSRPSSKANLNCPISCVSLSANSHLAPA